MKKDLHTIYHHISGTYAWRMQKHFGQITDERVPVGIAKQNHVFQHRCQ